MVSGSKEMETDTFAINRKLHYVKSCLVINIKFPVKFNSVSFIVFFRKLLLEFKPFFKELR